MTGIGGLTFLYRLWGPKGELLYVGVSENPLKRWGVHAVDKPWWPQVRRLEAVAVGDRTAAEVAEYVAIVRERPRYNRWPWKPPPGGVEAVQRSLKEKPLPPDEGVSTGGA
jgi:hypothetical protein